MGFETEAEAISAASKASGPYLIEFDGMNCNDYLAEDQSECGGWDGESRRCECGNRRVFWSTSQNADGSWCAYAEAY